MAENLAKNWWILLLRGIFAILFGTVALVFPGLALMALVLVFGIYALLDGGLIIFHALQNHEQNHNWGWNLAEGVISILAGLAAWFLTPLVGLTLVFIAGVYAILTGIMQLVSAWRLHGHIANEIFLGFAGVVSIIFGLLIFINPLEGALALALLIGFYAITSGVLMIAFSLGFRSLQPHQKRKNDEHFIYDRPLHGEM